MIYSKSTCVGAVIGRNLVEMYRKSSSQQSLSTAPCFYALQNILAFSTSAKQIAIQCITAFFNLNYLFLMLKVNLLQDLRIAMEQRINQLLAVSVTAASEENSIEVFIFPLDLYHSVTRD